MKRATQALVVEGRLERAPADRAAAGRMLHACARHVESADVRAAADPSGSYSLLYDAARKAVVAHMLCHGLRVPNRPGSHAAVVEYATVELAGVVPAEHLAHLDRMRRLRHDTEYDARPLTEQEVRVDLAHAREIVRALTRALFPPATR